MVTLEQIQEAGVSRRLRGVLTNPIRRFTFMLIRPYFHILLAENLTLRKRIVEYEDLLQQHRARTIDAEALSYRLASIEDRIARSASA